jgi:hypothetical protein
MDTQSWEMLSIGWKVTVKIFLVLTQTSQAPPPHTQQALPPSPISPPPSPPSPY